MLIASTAALLRRENVFSALTDGAKDGLQTVMKILPSLIALVTAVQMLRASGLTDALANAAAPLLNAFGLPSETAPLMLIRPISGSGALAVAGDIIEEYGADSLIGRTAAIMLGSTETTFYTIAVYFGAVGIKKTRFAIPAALTADLVGFIAAGITARLF